MNEKENRKSQIGKKAVKKVVKGLKQTHIPARKTLEQHDREIFKDLCKTLSLGGEVGLCDV